MMSVSWISPWSMDYAGFPGEAARALRARQQTYALAADTMMVGDPKIALRQQPTAGDRTPVCVHPIRPHLLSAVCALAYVC